MAQEEQGSITLRHMRSHGCRDLLVYCAGINCYHSSIMNADHLPDDMPIRSLGLRHVPAVWAPRS